VARQEAHEQTGTSRRLRYPFPNWPLGFPQDSSRAGFRRLQRPSLAPLKALTSQSHLPHFRNGDRFRQNPCGRSLWSLVFSGHFCRRMNAADLKVVPRFRQTSFMTCCPLSQEKSRRFQLPVHSPEVPPSPAFRSGSAFLHVYRRSFPAVADVRDFEVGFRYNLPLHQVPARTYRKLCRSAS
jgi:hypothetical protein